jgi:uncharacterized membrane protein YgcG
VIRAVADVAVGSTERIQICTVVHNENMTKLEASLRVAIRTLVRLWLLALGAAIVISIIVVALGIALLSVVWSLVRGRKPMAFTVFNQFRQSSQQFKTGQWNRARAASDAGASDVVDVQAREMPTAVIDNQPSNRP